MRPGLAAALALAAVLPRCAGAADCAIRSQPYSWIEDSARFTLECGDAAPGMVTWDFGDGAAPDTALGNAAVTHRYAAVGSYTIFARSPELDFPAIAQIMILHAPLPGKPSRSATLLLDARRNRVWCVNADNNSVTAIDTRTRARLAEIPVGRHPRTLAQDSLGRVWATGQDDATLTVIDGGSLQAIRTVRLPFGSRPYGICFDPAGGTAYVTLEAVGRLIRLDAASLAITGSLDLFPTPRAIAVTRDGSRILVTRFVSPADKGEVADVNAAPFALAGIIPLSYDTHPDNNSNGSGVPNSLAAVSISPDGRRAFVPFKKDNVRRGTFVAPGKPAPTFESTVRTVVAQLDLIDGKEDFSARKDLDNRSMADAVAFDGIGAFAYVATLASNHIAILNTATGTDATAIEPIDPEHELSPDGLVVAPGDSLLYVHWFLSREVGVYDITRVGAENAVTRLALIPAVAKEALAPEVLRGKRVFYNSADPRMARDRYLSCAVCHQDGGSDGRVWDFTHKGEGLRATPSLLGRGGLAAGPLHWSANFDEVQDFEHDVRDAFGGTGFIPDAVFHAGGHDKTLGAPKAGLSPELDDLAAYVSSLTEAHASPYREADGSRTAAARAGEAVFMGAEAGCARCHIPPLYTDSRLTSPGALPKAEMPGDVVTAEGFLLHDVGTLKPGSGMRLGDTLRGLDTPSLLGAWEKNAYLHDGSAASLMEVITTANPQDRHGRTSRLSATEKAQLVAFLEQLDGRDEGPQGIAPKAPAARSPGLAIARFAGGYRIRAPAGAGSGTFLLLTDARGTRVRRLGPNRAAGGPIEFDWDGRDAAGSTAPRGLYLLRAEPGGSAATLFVDP
jgi:YVTN family beta-propeller protein